MLRIFRTSTWFPSHKHSFSVPVLINKINAWLQSSMPGHFTGRYFLLPICISPLTTIVAKPHIKTYIKILPNLKCLNNTKQYSFSPPYNTSTHLTITILLPTTPNTRLCPRITTPNKTPHSINTPPYHTHPVPHLTHPTNTTRSVICHRSPHCSR